MFENQYSDNLATDIAREIVNNMFDGVFYKKEYCHVKTTKSIDTDEEKPAVGDNISNNSNFQSKVIACVHNFDKEDKKFEPNKQQVQNIRYTSGEPIILGYDKSSPQKPEIHCEICDNQSKFIIPKDHACPKTNQNQSVKMVGEANVQSGRIVTIQNSFEPKTDIQNPSVSGLSKSTHSNEFLDNEDEENDSEEDECDSLGTLEQKSDILDLVKSHPQKSSSNTSRKASENQDQWERTEESLIQVINLEWVEAPSPRSTKDPEETVAEVEFVLPKFDDEKMDVIDLNEIQKNHVGEGDDSVTQNLQQSAKISDGIEELSVPEEKMGNSSKTNTGSNDEKIEKKKWWNLAKAFNCFFRRRTKTLQSNDSVAN